jgi:hypothetical protein
MKSFVDYILTQHFMWKEFDAKKKFKITKEIIEPEGSKKAIFFFPYWTGKSKIYKKIAKKFPDYTLIFYDYPNEVMSEDVKVSLKYITEILNDAYNLIKDLRKSGYKEINLIGSSFGANIALKLSTMIEVDKVVLNMLDKNFAQSTFESPALMILKKKLENQGFTLKKLNQIYSFISTDYIVPKIKNRNKIKILIFLSKSDIFCTYDEFKPELKDFNKLKIHYQIKVNRFFGHIVGIYKNLFFNKRIVKFIRN